MVIFDKEILKNVKKNILPKEIFDIFHKIFQILDDTKDFSIFDIVKLKTSQKRTFFRLKKGKYRALFFIEEQNIYVSKLGTRENFYD